MSAIEEITTAARVAESIKHLPRERQLAVVWFVLDAVYAGEAFDAASIPSAEAFKAAPIAAGTHVQVDTTPTAPYRVAAPARPFVVDNTTGDVRAAPAATSADSGARAVETLTRMGYAAELAERAVEQALIDARAESSKAPTDRELMKRCMAIAARMKANPPKGKHDADRDPMVGADMSRKKPSERTKLQRALAAAIPGLTPSAASPVTGERQSNGKVKRGQARAELLGVLRNGPVSQEAIGVRLGITLAALEQRARPLLKSGEIVKDGYGKQATFALAAKKGAAA